MLKCMKNTVYNGGFQLRDANVRRFLSIICIILAQMKLSQRSTARFYIPNPYCSFSKNINSKFVAFPRCLSIRGNCYLKRVKVKNLMERRLKFGILFSYVCSFNLLTVCLLCDKESLYSGSGAAKGQVQDDTQQIYYQC